MFLEDFFEVQAGAGIADLSDGVDGRGPVPVVTPFEPFLPEDLHQVGKQLSRLEGAGDAEGRFNDIGAVGMYQLPEELLLLEIQHARL